jgi:hypothetical protein
MPEMVIIEMMDVKRQKSAGRRDAVTFCALAHGVLFYLRFELSPMVGLEIIRPVPNLTVKDFFKLAYDFIGEYQRRPSLSKSLIQAVS